MALLRNSKNDNGVLVKCISLNPENMEPRMVLKAVRGTHDQCTQQEVNKDDIVIMSTVTDTVTIDVLRVTKVTRYKTFMSKITGGDVDMSEGVNWLGLFKITDTLLLDWLVNVNDSPLLPPGYGWDGKRTRYEQAKLAEFQELFKDVATPLKEDIIDWAMVSPRENVNHQWNTAQSIPRDPIFLPNAKNVVSHFVVLWTDDGVAFEQYDDKDYKVEPLVVSSLQDDKVKKGLVCTVLSNKYGNNLRWKLYK